MINGYEANSYTKTLPGERRHVWRERPDGPWSVRVVRLEGSCLARELLDAFATPEAAMAWAEYPSHGRGTA